MPHHDVQPGPRRARIDALDDAEARGKLVLFYEPEGVLGGNFTCARCGAVSLQPDLMVHATTCPYATDSASITVW
jgi:hypothetical protein